MKTMELDCTLTPAKEVLGRIFELPTTHIVHQCEIKPFQKGKYSGFTISLSDFDLNVASKENDSDVYFLEYNYEPENLNKKIKGSNEQVADYIISRIEKALMVDFRDIAGKHSSLKWNASYSICFAEKDGVHYRIWMRTRDSKNYYFATDIRDFPNKHEQEKILSSFKEALQYCENYLNK